MPPHHRTDPRSMPLGEPGKASSTGAAGRFNPNPKIIAMGGAHPRIMKIGYARRAPDARERRLNLVPRVRK
jgi:hypothetical protein